MTSRILLAFLRRDALTKLSYRAEAALGVIGIAFSVATCHFMSRLLGPASSPAMAPYGGDYFPFVILGIAAASYQAAGLHSFAQNLRQEQLLGTLEAVLAAPVRFPVLLLAWGQWDFLRATLETALYLGAGWALFGLSFPAADVPAASLVFLLTLTACLSVGIASAAFMLRFKRGEPAAWVLGSVSELLGGVYFPVSLLPDWLRPASALFPVTHSLEGLRRTLLQGASLYEIRHSLAALGVFTAVLLPLGLYSFGKALDSARRDGSLGHY